MIRRALQRMIARARIDTERELVDFDVVLPEGTFRALREEMIRDGFTPDTHGADGVLIINTANGPTTILRRKAP